MRVHQAQDPHGNQWLYSGPIDITSSRSLCFTLTRAVGPAFANPAYNTQDADGLDSMFLKLDIVKFQTSLFLSFIAMNQDNYSYLLRNDTYNFLIKYRQNLLDMDTPELLLLKHTSRPFAWTCPDSKPELEVSFMHMSEQLMPLKFVFNLNTIIESRDLILPLKNGENKRVKIRTVIHGPTRVLQFFEPSEEDPMGSSFQMSEIMVGDHQRRLSSLLVGRAKARMPGALQKEKTKTEHLIKMYQSQDIDDAIQENPHRVSISQYQRP